MKLLLDDIRRLPHPDPVDAISEVSTDRILFSVDYSIISGYNQEVTPRSFLPGLCSSTDRRKSAAGLRRGSWVRRGFLAASADVVVELAGGGDGGVVEDSDDVALVGLAGVDDAVGVLWCAGGAECVVVSADRQSSEPSW
jgi:hypothetical protein